MGNDLHSSCCDVCSPFDNTDKRDRNLNQSLKQSQQQFTSTITSESDQVYLYIFGILLYIQSILYILCGTK